MRVLEIRPPAPLSEAVLLLTSVELEGAADFGPPECIVPDGIVEIVFQNQTPFLLRHRGESFAPLPAACAISQTHRFVEIAPQGACSFVSARLFPWGASRLFGIPVSEFSDRVIPAELLWEDSFELQEQLAAATGGRNRLTLLGRFLTRKLIDDRGKIGSWVRAIQSQGGNVGIARLCSDLGVGQRRLERHFQRSLGTSAKHFARLTRFLCACHALKNGGSHRLAEVALECGYSDQAHFNRNFKAFSGLAPRQFLARPVSFLSGDH